MNKKTKQRAKSKETPFKIKMIKETIITKEKVR